MRAVIQRVTWGSVTVEGKCIAEVSAGYVILLGIYETDTTKDVDQCVEKLLNLRIMSDESGRMNKSILDTQGEILLVSQFTLCADLTYGRRPSFIKAMQPDEAHKIYEYMKELIQNKGIVVKTGLFGHYMDVQIHNDGPVTIVLDTNKL